MSKGASINSARPIARLVASISTSWGREAAWYLEQAKGLELRRHPGSYVAVFGVDHGCDTCSSRGEEDVEDFIFAELEGGVGHVDLEGGDVRE